VEAVIYLAATVGGAITGFFISRRSDLYIAQTSIGGAYCLAGVFLLTLGMTAGLPQAAS
jgi:hypothetical protein